MKPSVRFSFLAMVVIGVLGVLATTAQAQTYKGDVGYNRLVSQQGAGLADGAGLRVGLIEARINNATGPYMPVPADPNDYESFFSGKTINNVSGSNSDVSSHSRISARNFFGSSFSMSGGIDDIDVFEANDWIGGGFLRALSGLDPLSTDHKVTSHSYAGTESNNAVKVDLLQRLDYVVNRDDMFVSVGTFNSGATRDLWAPSYNAVTVGISAGTSATGLTSDYGNPRQKVDIVVPVGSSSSATPIVASAAALLIDSGNGTNATRNEVVRALLFAGATKNESEAAFADWDRTATRPIDDRLGFGELNVYNSFQMLQGGEFEGSTSEPVTISGRQGYDYGDFDGTNDLFYDFEIFAGGKTLSAVLTWNAEITDADPTTGFNPSFSVADLDLQLYDSSGTFMGSLVDQSISTDYNHEHIYLTDLAAGRYTFRISGDSATDFGFAWQVVPEPSSGLLALACVSGMLLRRRKTS